MGTPYTVENESAIDAIADGDLIRFYDVSAKAYASGSALQIRTFLMGQVAIDVSTTITSPLHSGRTLLMGGAGSARTHTLPAATGSGNIYTFVVGAVNTSNFLIKVVGNDTMDGQIVSAQDAADTTVSWETAADSDTITLNGTTTGGAAIGDSITLRDIATDQWAVSGLTTSTGTEATPFSATVT